MLSRVADALYWMSRYLERAEHSARVLEVSRRALIDLRDVDPEEAQKHWQGTLHALDMPECNADDALYSATEESSVHYSLVRARENGRQVREVISSEMWTYLNQAYWALSEASRSKSRTERTPQVLDDVLRASFLWGGATDATMPRGEGWLFIRLGQFVERGTSVSRLFETRWAQALGDADNSQQGTPRPQDNVRWINLLKSCSCLEAYRKLHPARIDARHIADFLLLGKSIPRTPRYSFGVCHEFARRISQLTEFRGDEMVRAFGKLDAYFAFADVDEVLEVGPSSFLREGQDKLNLATLELQRTYFWD